jgi:carbonic anhydrase
VLTCIDSRIDPLAMLGLESGDAKIVRAPMSNESARSGASTRWRSEDSSTT